MSAPRAVRPPGGGGRGRVHFGNQAARVQRLDDQFHAVQAALGTQIQLAESIQAADPQLVLVMEAREENIDLSGVAAGLGIEIISAAETRVDPDDEFLLASEKPRIPLVSSCLHAVCINQSSLDELLGLWRAWKSGEVLPWGRTPLRDFFAHLKDVRAWGPQDRLKLVDWADHFRGREPDALVSIDIELWFRLSSDLRMRAQSEVAALLQRDGGTVASSAVIEDIGYHGLKATVPNRIVEQLAYGHFDAVQTVQSASVMYLRATGQVALPMSDETELDATTDEAVPTRAPVLCLLDGAPAANHPLLTGRVLVLDPDDMESDYTVDERRHGTAMASAAIWGDRGNEERAAARPVLVRPILRPCDETMDRAEELPVEALAPDLMRRAFRDLFEEGSDGTPASAPEVAIVNLSVGDPAAPFDTVLSSWARMIDWLSYHYGVLAIVSAGNYTSLDLTPSNSAELAALTGDDRRQATLMGLERQQNQRRLIAPAESINALTVGATHDDAAESPSLGYRVDPNDGLTSVSPVSATGSGYRRSLKPDLAAPGGRAYFASGGSVSNVINFRPASAAGPGIKVAAANAGRETYTIGTSVSAALVSRCAARLHDIVDAVTEGTPITRRQRASAIKALLLHGVAGFDDLPATPLPIERAIGYGVLRRDFSAGCATNEAVLLFVGQIGAAQEQELRIPLPDGLSVREAKRIDATLAWLSPVNWRHRQYRRAALSFVTPEGPIPKLGSATGISADGSKAGAATVQHLTWGMETAWASGQGSAITIRVKCFEQAGGLNGELVDYAAVASIWVAPTVGVDVYSQVRDQVRTPVTIQPTS
ncbi:MAG: S8 family peptidase [Nocardioides sp.]